MFVDNCKIPGWSIFRATSGLPSGRIWVIENPYSRIFYAVREIPRSNYNVNWRKNMVGKITKIRLVGTSLKRQIKRKPLHDFEKY